MMTPEQVFNNIQIAHKLEEVKQNSGNLKPTQNKQRKTWGKFSWAQDYLQGAVDGITETPFVLNQARNLLSNVVNDPFNNLIGKHIGWKFDSDEENIRDLKRDEEWNDAVKKYTDFGGDRDSFFYNVGQVLDPITIAATVASFGGAGAAKTMTKEAIEAATKKALKETISEGAERVAKNGVKNSAINFARKTGNFAKNVFMNPTATLGASTIKNPIVRGVVEPLVSMSVGPRSRIPGITTMIGKSLYGIQSQVDNDAKKEGLYRDVSLEDFSKQLMDLGISPAEAEKKMKEFVVEKKNYGFIK